MGDMKLLDDKIRASGQTITFLSAKLGLSRQCLYNKMAGESEFKASEIAELTRLLHLNKAERDAIFLN